MLPNLLIQSLKNIKGFNECSFLEVHSVAKQITSIRLNPDKIIGIGDLELGLENLELGMKHEELGFYNEIIKTRNEEQETRNEKQEEQETRNVKWCKHGYYLPKRPSFTFDPLFHAGTYYVQEASSMFLWQILEQIIGSDTKKTVLDLCAAPGGKSTLLASYFKDGLIISNEVIKQRAAVLVENITKWGCSNVVVTNNDPAHFKQLNDFFDIIVIDAPCSGSGLFRKDINAITEWSEENVNHCSQRQKRIIADIINSLTENGILIYSTCSYSKAENEDVLDWITSTYKLTSIPLTLQPNWGIISVNSDLHNAFGYRFYPDKLEGEGFFISVFKKEITTEVFKKNKQSILPIATKQEVDIINNFIAIPNNFYLFKQNEFIRVFPLNYLQQLQILVSYLYIKKAGIEIGAVKGKDLIPSHELAMSHLDLRKIIKYKLNKHQALQYLSKKEVIIDTNSTGWVLAIYNNIPLGWMKVLPNRINNYYPTEWRILKTNI